MKVKIRAWLEERELDGLVPPLRARVEVERRESYEPVHPAPRSVQEIHDTLDQILMDAGITDADADSHPDPAGDKT